MCYALATWRPDVLPCREEGRDSKERGGDPSPPLSLAGRGGSEGLLTARHPFEYSSLHFCKLTIESGFHSDRSKKTKRIFRRALKIFFTIIKSFLEFLEPFSQKRF